MGGRDAVLQKQIPERVVGVLLRPSARVCPVDVVVNDGSKEGTRVSRREHYPPEKARNAGTVRLKASRDSQTGPPADRLPQSVDVPAFVLLMDLDD